MTALERMARAIADNVPVNSGDLGPDWMCCVGTARAALLAIRESAPTVRNVDAGVHGYADIVTIYCDGWENLIDAILNEKPE